MYIMSAVFLFDQVLACTESATSEYSTTSQCLSALLGRPGRVKFIRVVRTMQIGECLEGSVIKYQEGSVIKYREGSYLHRPHNSGLIQWARGGVGSKPSAAARPNGLRWTKTPTHLPLLYDHCLATQHPYV